MRNILSHELGTERAISLIQVCVWNFSREVKLVPTLSALHLFIYPVMHLWNLIHFALVFVVEFGILHWDEEFSWVLFFT